MDLKEALKKALPKIVKEVQAPALAEPVPDSIKPIYRVWQQTRVYGNPPGKPQKIWEGSDIRQLSGLYPRTYIHEADQLRIIAGDREHTDTWFEKCESGNWERCPDPRRHEEPEPGDIQIERRIEKKRRW